MTFFFLQNEFSSSKVNVKKCQTILHHRVSRRLLFHTLTGDGQNSDDLRAASLSPPSAKLDKTHLWYLKIE